MKKCLSLSVGISAYNEEGNIKNLLTSVLSQKDNCFNLLQIIVISDGSTDRTVAFANELRDKRITVIEKRKREGQNRRLNEILRLFRGDLLAIFDADEMLGESTLKELVIPFLKHSDIAVAHGQNKPIPKNFDNYWSNVFTFIDTLKIDQFQKLNHGDNIYLGSSCRVLSRRLIEKFRWPDDVAEDSYLILFCKKNRFKIAYTPNAVVYYCSPGSLSDYFKKTDKYNKGKLNLSNYFSNDMISSNFSIPVTWLLNFFLIGLISAPHYMIGYFLGLFFSKCYMLLTPEFTPKWDISHTTKKFQGD